MTRLVVYLIVLLGVLLLCAYGGIWLLEVDLAKAGSLRVLLALCAFDVAARFGMKFVDIARVLFYTIRGDRR